MAGARKMHPLLCHRDLQIAGEPYLLEIRLVWSPPYLGTESPEPEPPDVDVLGEYPVLVWESELNLFGSGPGFIN